MFVTGGRGVFLGRPWLYPRKTVPECLGIGIYGYGYRVWSGSHVPEGIVGYGILCHEGIRIWIKKQTQVVFLILAICNKKNKYSNCSYDNELSNTEST